jgi:anti-sigma factor RsiW
MTCDELLAALVDFVGGEMVAEHRRTVEVHIRACPHCAVYVATYTHTIRIARALPKSGALPPAMEARLREVLQPELDKRDGAGS